MKPVPKADSSSVASCLPKVYLMTPLESLSHWNRIFVIVMLLMLQVQLKEDAYNLTSDENSAVTITSALILLSVIVAVVMKCFRSSHWNFSHHEYSAVLKAGFQRMEGKNQAL